jgi:hypothetical protein
MYKNTELSFDEQLRIVRSHYYGYTYKEMKKELHHGETTMAYVLSQGNLEEIVVGLCHKNNHLTGELNTEKLWCKFLYSSFLIMSFVMGFIITITLNQ